METTAAQKMRRMLSCGSPLDFGSKPSYRFAAGLQVDAELLAFFIKVAALQAQGAGGLGDVAVIAIELRQHRSAFEILHALGQRGGTDRARISALRRGLG